MSEVGQRIDDCDWPAVDSQLDAYAVARLGSLLTPSQCAELRSAYDDTARFRSRVVMARHGFGQGEYRYFSYPLPELVAELRSAVYPHAARTANRWNAMLGSDARFPDSHREMLSRCREAGQVRPTPLLLRYGPGDYNCLHQDIYGAFVFSLQLVVLLSDPGSFSGGEFVITEQRPRMQSRVEVVALGLGEAALFAVNERPRKGSRGYHRARIRHGVSRVHRGERFALGVIFHDAA